MTAARYLGNELELFARARRWKAYWSTQVRPYVRGAVLETGAGLGTNTPLLQTPLVTSWTCLEPDAEFARHLRAQTVAGTTAPQVVHGTLTAVPAGQRFDTVIYIDVLEHIADDGTEMLMAARHLHPAGHLIVLAPAHQGLFTSFDTAIGHQRRYSRESLAALRPPGCALVRSRYLDSAGLLASLANRYLLKQSLPTTRQVAVWDRLLVPTSRLLDGWTDYRLGKSVLAVWRKQEE